MKRLMVALTALAIAGPSAEGLANQGYYDQYGYQAPGKYQRGNGLNGEESKQKAKQSAKADDGGKPVKEPGVLSGGPKPYIGAVTPPKVTFPNSYGAGTIVIDTARRKLYYVLSSSQAYRYPISVGREGFTWTGTHKISKEVDWPDWRPPAEMLERKPNLPELMTGGIRNPLGVKALYLGNTLYRIHGTNDAKSIGYAASSGCIRMHNGHVVHLAGMAGVGTTVHVVKKLPSSMANAN